MQNFKDQPVVFEPTTVPHYETQLQGNITMSGALVGLGTFAVAMYFFYTEDMEFIRTQQPFEYWAIASGMGLLSLLVTSDLNVSLDSSPCAMALYAERREERGERTESQ